MGQTGQRYGINYLERQAGDWLQSLHSRAMVDTQDLRGGPIREGWRVLWPW